MTDRPDLLDELLVEAVSLGRLSMDEAAEIGDYADLRAWIAEQWPSPPAEGDDE